VNVTVVARHFAAFSFLLYAFTNLSTRLEMSQEMFFNTFGTGVRFPNPA